MALYEVVLNTQYLEQQFVNRWNYVSSGTPTGVTGSFALIHALGFYPDTGVLFPTETLGGYLQAMLNSQCIFVQAMARNVYDPTDFYDLPLITGMVGLVVGEGLSPVEAIGLTSNRVRTDIRRGQKRFSGLPAAFSGNGGQLSAGAIASAENVAEEMSATLEYNDGSSLLPFTPVIVGKEKYETESGKFAYRYYSTLTAQLAHMAQGISWDVKPQIRTQGSRQYGRGA